MVYNTQKILYGQFFTKETVWLKNHIKNFILSSNKSVVYDPFAGNGDLLNVAINLGFNHTKGLDIDKTLQWEYNDSLVSIPHIDNAIIITNPPYLTNYSASRKKINDNVSKYFDNTKYDDVYLLALEKMLKAQDYVVAIIPETFINSNFSQKEKLYSLTVLEDNPFCDTDTPVLVACFDSKIKSLNHVKVFKNEKYINNLGEIESLRLTPKKNVDMIFNDKNGWLGVRCVDNTNPNDMIKFDLKENIDYNWEKGIKVSSRLLTLIQIDVPNDKKSDFIYTCNDILLKTRNDTDDLILSPFKGNMKNGRRRRRLDFLTCRAIIEKAYYKVVDNLAGGLFYEN